MAEFQTIDVGRIEATVTIWDGSRFNIVILGKVVLHGNKAIKACSAKDTYDRFINGKRKTLLTVTGQPILIKDIKEFNITKESAELVTFAQIPRN